jgi:hypothetical protein
LNDGFTELEIMGTLTAGAVAMTMIVAFIVWWGYHASQALKPQNKKGGPKPPWSNEQLARRKTNEPLPADHRNFYKVEKWTKDGARAEQKAPARNP